MFAVFKRLFGSILHQLNDIQSPGPQPNDIRRAILHAYRRSLLKGAATGRFRKEARMARRRFARNKTQKLAKSLRRGVKIMPLDASALLGRYTPSPILDALVPEREKHWVPVLKRDRQATPPEIQLMNFSILEHPRETIKAVKRLATIANEALEAQLHFDDPYCTDMAAYLVLAEVWPAFCHVYRGGRISIAMQKVIEAVRLRYALSMKFKKQASSSDIWAYPLHRRRPSKISKSSERNLVPQTREKVADGFCEAVDEWLGITADLGLTEDGKANFANLIGELLDNAERHSDLSKDGSWSIAAFMARRKEGQEFVYRCHMAFLSEGISIAESLDTAAPKVREEVDRYCMRHRRAGQSRDTLATLMALQDTITRDAAATADSRGGIGFQDVLEFVTTFGANEIADRSPRFTIVSGRSCIQLRPPYMFGRRAGRTEPRLLWCNQGNSPSWPPDLDCVFDLEDHFAGTIVGLSFVLDSENLRKSIDA
ncbi:hypothetical protein [Bradyrhizobium sp. CCGUVB23]|uniref:hypothetical protein n=1 Tax=Bradyrhizobium sp. CCGUVB23 TaxID=2949630 RepID=UPI0020B291EA|nr:hypothetical protein [Bradyrhizobium sp. CCGUVB23]MCP3460317.1 hypothetical protein [Bradyrhizobium sp. CCGUVB23]